MMPRPTAPLLVLFGLITAAGGWLLLFGGSGGEPADLIPPDAPLLAEPPPTTAPVAPTSTLSPTTAPVAPPPTAASPTTTTPAPASPYGARADGGWALPALDGGPDVDADRFGDRTLVVVVSSACAECPATARAAVAAANEFGIADSVVVFTFVDGVDAEELGRLVEEWAIPGARYARDVWLGDHWARSDILPDAVPIIGVWAGGAGHAGGWSLLAAGAHDAGAARFLLATSAPTPDPWVENPDVVGDGWEVIDLPWGATPRPQAVMQEINGELVIWGGTSALSDDRVPSLTEGWAWALGRGWRQLAAGPLCSLFTPGSVVAGGEMIVWGGAAEDGDCATQAAYDPAADTWRRLDAALFRRAGRSSPIVWTGEWLVGPTVGLAFDPAAGTDLEIPPIPTATASSSPVRAHWTGDRVLAIGPAALYAWSPGDAEWEDLGNPAVGRIGRDSVLGGDALWVVDYDMAAARFRLDGSGWERVDNLPLRFYECLAEAGSVGGLVVVKMCSGYAAFDDVRSSWVPIPLGRGDGLSLIGRTALYEIWEDLRRFEVVRGKDGRIALPPSIPVGVFQLELGNEWDLTSSIGLTGVPAPGSPEQPPEEVQSFALENAAGESCRVAARYAGGIGGVTGGSEYRETVSARTGRAHPTLVVPAGIWDDFEHVVVASYNGSDVVDITCRDAAAAADLATRLWSYHE